MSQEDILAGLAAIVNEVAGIPAENVQMEKSFVDDLDVDSLSMVEVVMACEDKFGVTIPDTEVKNLNTVGMPSTSSLQTSSNISQVFNVAGGMRRLPRKDN